MRTLSLPLLATLAVATPAAAGIHARDVDFLFVAPSVGAEGLDLRADGFAPSMSLSLGAQIGVRAGLLSLSLLLQRGTHTPDPTRPEMRLVADKVFGDLGIHVHLGRHVAISPHLALGLATLRSDAFAPLKGPGGKLGLSVELFPVAALSVGMRVDADGQAYSDAGAMTLAYGFTISGSIGLHL